MMKRKIVKCPIDNMDYNKEVKCPQLSCDSCPKKIITSSSNKDIYSSPLFFRKAYLNYLSGKEVIRCSGGSVCGLPTLFMLTNNYHRSLIDQPHTERDMSFINTVIVNVAKSLSKKTLKQLDLIPVQTRVKVLIALHDLSDAFIVQELGIKKHCKRGNKERKKSISAVKNLLSLPILNQEEKEVLNGIQNILTELDKPLKYTASFDLLLHEINLLPEARQYYTSSSILAHDKYLVTHKNLRVPNTKPYRFFKNVLQATILALLLEEGKQKPEISKNLTCTLIKEYLSNGNNQEYSKLADQFTYKTVERSLSV